MTTGTTTPSDIQQKLYGPAFLRNCMLLLVRAHRRLNVATLQRAEEPHITGELVRAAVDLLESSDAEPWMEHLQIFDDPPQNVPGRFGKRRPRIDIEFIQTQHGRRPRFHVEAKRLYRSDSANEYFGEDGLLMFLNGSYADGWPYAGMLGYAQSDGCIQWSLRLEQALGRRRNPLRIREAGHPWEEAGWRGDGLDSVKVSAHRRVPQNEAAIQIFHLLLSFV